MCEKCDAIRAQLAAMSKGTTDPTTALAGMAVKMIEDMFNVEVEIMVCGVIDQRTGQETEMRLVTEESFVELAGRLKMIGSMLITSIQESVKAKQALDLMHSNLQQMSKIINATGDAVAITALDSLHASYEAKMDALQNSQKASIAEAMKDANLSAEALLSDPDVPEEVKASVRALLKRTAAMPNSNGSVH